MKILVITDLYPIRDNEIYTPKTIYDFVQEWKNLGHEVKIIKPNFILNSFIRKKTYYKSGFYGNVENINYFLPFLGNIKQKCKTIKQFKPDIIISHMPSGIIFSNKLGLDFSAAVHSSDLEVLTNPIYRFYFKPEMEKAYKNAKKIICRSYALKDKFLKLYPEFKTKTFAAPSGINFKPVKKEWSNNKSIKVLTCGQFIKRKNIDKVIDACNKINNVELTVIGSGKLEKKLKNLSSETTFTGQLEHNNVLTKMKESDIFILPSINETFGMVYLEAMACGCITVCCENEGIAGIIKDSENGFLTTPDTVEKTINRIIKHCDKNLILNNTYNTILCYTGKQTARDYLSILMG